MNVITEQSRTLPVVRECDVLVAGGGIAGIAAALAAARSGARTILAEKQCLLGGLATLGLVTIYLPLCDGMGNQLIFGIGEELLRLSIKHGAEARRPDAWLDGGTKEERTKSRFLVQYNPHFFCLEAEKLLRESGVQIFYDTKICETVVNKGIIEAVILENSSGRSAIKVKSVVDSTGNADICALSGEKTAVRNDNAVAAWHYAVDRGKIKLTPLGAMDDGRPVERIGGLSYTGITADEVNDFLYNSHENMLKSITKKQSENPDYFPVTLPAIPQLRMTRRLVGAYEQGDDEAHRQFEDSIGLTGDWRKKGPAYSLPLRVLYGREIGNLITAGRCISVTDEMWDITRVIPTCAVTGEAAGTAAAMLKTAFSEIPVEDLQNNLINNGVKISL